MDLSEAAWPDARDADTNLAILPVGSTEQHGPHAPLGTDTFAAAAVADAGADVYASEYGGDVVVAPAIPVGVSEEHRQFPGTLYVSPDTFRAYVRDTVASLAETGFDRVVVVNGHGGNVAALREACARLVRDEVAYAVPFTWFEAVSSDVGMGHAGPLETALLRAVRPDAVHEDRVADAAADAASRWGEWTESVNLAYDTAEFAANGVVGDPREGDAELGAQLVAEAAESVAVLLDCVATRDIDRPEARR